MTKKRRKKLRIEKTNQRIHNRFRSKNIYASKEWDFMGEQRARKHTATEKNKRSKIINRNHKKLISFSLIVCCLFSTSQHRWEKKKEIRIKKVRRRKKNSNKHTRFFREPHHKVVSSLLSFLTLYIFILMADNKIKINETFEIQSDPVGKVWLRKVGKNMILMRF